MPGCPDGEPFAIGKVRRAWGVYRSDECEAFALAGVVAVVHAFAPQEWFAHEDLGGWQVSNTTVD